MKTNTKIIKTVIIGTVSLIFISLITYTVYFFIDNGNRNEKTKSIDVNESLTQMDEDEVNSAVLKKGYSDEEVDSMTKEQKDKILMGMDYYYEDNKIRLYSNNSRAKEYTGDANKKYKELTEKFTNFEYDAITAEIQKILEDYNLTKGDNLKLAAMYSDATKMGEYKKLGKNEKEMILRGHHDPVALVADTLYAYVRRREAVILDGASKTPVFSGSFSIDGIGRLKESDEKYDYYEGLWKGESVKNIYKVDLTIPDAPDMYAIVLESAGGELRIAGYYGDSANIYMSVSERKEMGVDRE